MIAIVNYGVGNLFSLQSSLRALGIAAAVTADEKLLAAADKLILPGVGAFADAAAKLRESGLAQVILGQAARGKPLLGICLGMQLLFGQSREFGTHKGLALIQGEVTSLQHNLRAAGYPYKVPHIGWNSLHLVNTHCPLLKYTQEDDAVYYVHSFYVPAGNPNVAASSEYGVQVAGAVQNGNIFGTQFHPEKSGVVGLRILKAFAEL